MLSERLSSVDIVVLLLGGMTMLTILVLGMLVICRARRRDLPKIVKELGGWLRRFRK